MREHIVCGPWVGEFGYELMHWQGYLRKLADENRRAEFTVICEAGHDCLYEDFAHNILRADFPTMNRNGDLNPGVNMDITVSSATRYIRPFNTTELEQRFVRLGSASYGTEFDVMVHARYSAKGGDMHKNWKVNHWDDLVDRLLNMDLTVGAYGSKEGAICPHEDATNLIGAYLRTTAAALAKCRIAVGTTSGAMELASLCGTPTIEWGGGDQADWTDKRYAASIFNSRLDVVSNSWQPTVDEVFSVIQKRLT